MSTQLALSTGLGLPWPAAINPFQMQHALRSQATAFELGVLSPGSKPDQRRFEAFVEADAWAYPYASLERLHAAGGFNQWLYLLDDQYDDDAAGRDPIAVRRLMERTFAILETGDLPRGKGAPTAFDHFSHDVRWRLSELAPAGWLERFLADTHDYLFEGSLAVIEKWSSGAAIDLETYVELRLYDSSLHAVFDVVELAADARLPREVLALPALRELRLAAARHVAFGNDLFSYHKEVVRQGSRFNLLHVLCEDRRLSLAEAVIEATAMLDRDVQRFVAIEASLPRTSVEVDSGLARYVDGLKAWMTGNIAFSRRSPRFRAPDAVFAELRGPT